MIPEKERNEIIDLLIEKLGSSDSEVPYSEIEKKYNINRTVLLNEILRELSNQGIIKESGNIFHEARLLAKGLEIKRSGGWLTKIEEENRKAENQRIRNAAELENLKFSTKLSKIQIRWFKISLIVGFIGGLSGILALILELNNQRKEENSKENPVKMENPKITVDTLSTTQDSIKKQ